MSRACLCYDPKFFMQSLEGPKDAVNQLYGDIARDSRHTRVTPLEYHEIEKRTLGDWSMVFVQASDLDAKMLRKYGSRGKFDAFTLSTHIGAHDDYRLMQACDQLYCELCPPCS